MASPSAICTGWFSIRDHAMNLEINWRGLIVLFLILTTLVSTFLYIISTIIIAGVKHMFLLISFLLGLFLGLGKRYVVSFSKWAFGRLKHAIKGELGMESPPPPANGGIGEGLLNKKEDK